MTGSCHLVQAQELNILVDCGAVQRKDRAATMEEWPLAPAAIHYVLLTHAHIDHIGGLPGLIQAGFKGEILATHPTKALLLPMLKDAMSFSRLSTVEAERLGAAIERLSWGFDNGEEGELKHGLCFSFHQAGHILGSAFIHLKGANPPWSIVFSGDLGARNTPLLPDPEPPPACDLLVLEATYGDRLRRIPVVVDSPLGLELTKLTSSFSAYWDREAQTLLQQGDHPLDFDGLYACGSHRDHLRLIEQPGPAVIIAGSGMCTGGRIVDHLKAGLEDPKNDVLFVGYQAEGTPGREIQRYAGKPDGFVMFDGERCRIRARVHVLGGYSAHADQRGLIEWVRSMPAKPRRIKLVHGDATAGANLKSVWVRGESVSR